MRFNPGANPFFAGLQNQIIQAAIQRQKQVEEEQKARLQQIHPAFRPNLPMFPFGQAVSLFISYSNPSRRLEPRSARTSRIATTKSAAWSSAGNSIKSDSTTSSQPLP